MSLDKIVLLGLIGFSAILLIAVYRRNKELAAALQEAKTVSEIKINARTRELKELSEGLEDRVEERTRELKMKLEELQRFQELTIGRELKMIALKKELEELLKKEHGSQKKEN